MVFGNAAWGFRKLPLAKQLKITHEMGLELLELGIANAPEDLSLKACERELENVRNLYNKYHVKLMYASTGNDFSNGNKDDVEKVKKVIDICKELKVKYLRIFSGFSPVEEVIGERWKNMIDCICEVDLYSQQKGVYLVIETHGGVKTYSDGVEHFMSTSSQPETLYRMLEEVPETVKVNFDPANLWAVGVKHPEKVYEACGERVAMVHFKDFVRLPSGHLRSTACGESDLDWNAILHVLRDYQGAGLFEYENTENVKEGSIQCLNYIKHLIDKRE